MNAGREMRERADAGPLPPRAGGDGSPPALGSIGEGLLEVEIAPGLDPGQLGRGYGGDAANVAVMAAGMGVRSFLLTRVGDDAVGRLLLDFWKERGVETGRIAIDDGAATGLYVNEQIGSDGHNFAYYRTNSAASLLGPADVEGGTLDGLDLLYLSGITLSISASAADAARRAIERARDAGIEIAFDFNFRPLLGASPEAILEIARSADVVLLAHADAEAVLDSSSPREVLAALGRGPREVVLTNGGEEVLLFTPEASFALAPPTVQVVNAAGAGDALAGAYLASRLRGVAPGDALTLAVAAASRSCTRPGCARAYPVAAEVEADAAGLTAEERPPVGAMTAGREAPSR